MHAFRFIYFIWHRIEMIYILRKSFHLHSESFEGLLPSNSVRYHLCGSSRCIACTHSYAILVCIVLVPLWFVGWAVDRCWSLLISGCGIIDDGKCIQWLYVWNYWYYSIYLSWSQRNISSFVARDDGIRLSSIIRDYYKSKCNCDIVLHK